jgi:hypothetical protein
MIDPSIDDNLDVYKYGVAKKLNVRLNQHNTGLGSLPGVTLRLSAYHIIDSDFEFQAEECIREDCKDLGFSLDMPSENPIKYRELIALNPKQFKHLKKQYGVAGGLYAGATSEMQQLLKTAEEQLKNAEEQLKTATHNHTVELLEKDKLIMVEQANTKQEKHNRLIIEKDLSFANRMAEMEKELFQQKIMNYELTKGNH